MAGSSLLALIDDIATLLDDVSVMTQLAAKKTAGVLGDDLALNAEQVSGVRAERELPVVWAVAKGSLVNKAILVPAALAISALLPWAITPLLMAGGLYLCFEGVEKLAHKFLHPQEAAAHPAARTQARARSREELVALEKEKIKGAVRTDFILSAEIIVISLGVVSSAAFMIQVLALVGVAVLMTVGVYGLVAGIVKLDDVGLFLSQREGGGPGGRVLRGLGTGLLRAAPWLMKALSVAGTAAMFLVGGGILTHGIAPLHHALEALAEHAGRVPGLGGLLQTLTPPLINAGVGILAGAAALGVVSLGQRVLRRGRERREGP